MPYIQIKTPSGFTPECSAIFDTDLANIPRSKSVKLRAGTLLKIDPDDYASEPKPNFNRIRGLVQSEVVEKINNHQEGVANLQLLEDEWFTPSESAVFVKGSAQNGWEFWVVSEVGHQLFGKVINVFRDARKQNENDAQIGAPVLDSKGKSLTVGPDTQWEIGLLSNKVFTNILNENFYNELQVVMFADGRFFSLVGLNAWNPLNWPNGPGVYAVWKSQGNTKKELLYVGMCGKHYNDGEINGGNLPDRLTRWYPYCFQTRGQFVNNFEYQPLATGNELLSLPHANRYGQHIPAIEITVDCFKLDGLTRRLAPTLLESLILQNYFFIKGFLPTANNQF
jgi:hypothetical protein